MVCHSPNAGGKVFLRLADKETGKPLTEEQAKRLLKGNYKKLVNSTAPHGNASSDKVLWEIVSSLNGNNEKTKVTFIGSISATNGVEAHKLALKKDAVRECEKCHSAESPAFRDVSVAIIKNNGEKEFFNAHGEVLGSIFSVLSASQFYALGSTRLKILDVIGILMVAGGVSFPLTHLVLRIVTAPIRKRRKEKSK